jgi:drug/metabolite transporter (DMT)-like permease
MHWSLWIIIAGIINAVVNTGYKVNAAKDSVFLFCAFVMAMASISLFAYVSATKGIRLNDVTDGKTPWVILAMGIGTAAILIFFITGLAKGPISLADPLLTCVYALVSVFIGLAVLREAPSMTALAGVGLYLGGAFLMARG